MADSFSVTEHEWARVWAEAELDKELKDTLQKDPVQAVQDFNVLPGVKKVDFKLGYTKIYNLNLVDSYYDLLLMTAQKLDLIWRQEAKYIWADERDEQGHPKANPTLTGKTFEILDNFWVTSLTDETSVVRGEPYDRPELPVERIPLNWPPPKPGRRLSAKDWGRIFAYLFWLRAMEQYELYSSLRAQCEYHLSRGVQLIVKRINENSKNPILEDYEYLFQAFVPEDWKEIPGNFFKNIAEGKKPTYSIGMRMSC